MSIYPDKDKQGKLTGQYRVEVQYKGTRARGRFVTLAEAQVADKQWKLELVSTKGSSSTKAPSRLKPLTLGELFDHAKDTLWRGKTTEESSLQRCMATIAHLGADTALSSLTAVSIDSLIVSLQVSKADATVNRYLSALHTLLRWGVTRHYLLTIPPFTWQEEDEGRIRWITEEEETRLLSILPPIMADLVAVAIATGMRRNEILTLTPDNLELHWVRLWKTKNGMPRSVPIDGETHLRLQRLLQDMPSQHRLRYAWDVAKKAMGLEKDDLFVFHACRHTCATRLVRDNINIRIIQRWLGHKRIETTLRYSHVNDTMLADALAQRSHKDIRVMTHTQHPPN